jgi:cullin-associated NEDD8-dissociated protein 1
MCCQQIMAEISEEFSGVVIKAIYPTIERGLNSDDDQTCEEFVDLLTELLKKFTKTLINDNSLIDESTLLINLFDRLQNSENIPLNKKLTQCLGFLSVVLTTKDIESLTDCICGSITPQEGGSKKMYFNIQTLCWVASKIGYKLGPWLERIMDSLFAITDLLNYGESEDQMNDIVEEVLNSIEYLVQRCPKEITPRIKDILKMSQDFMKYDPNFAYDDEEEMEDDDDDGWVNEGAESEDDDEDSSWKIRRGAIKVILAILHSRPEMLRFIYSTLSVEIVNRFRERDANIQVIVLDAFGALLRSSFLTNISAEKDEGASLGVLIRQRSSIEELFQHVDYFVKKLMKISNTKKSSIQIAILKIFVELSRTMPT